MHIDNYRRGFYDRQQARDEQRNKKFLRRAKSRLEGVQRRRFHQPNVAILEKK